MISLVYGDSYRANVLFSSIPAPVPDRWGQGLHIMCDLFFQCYNLQHTTAISRVKATYFVLFKKWRKLVGSICAPLGTLSSFNAPEIFSSPEPKAHGELLWSLTVRRRRCRRRRRRRSHPDVRLSTIFKQHLLLNHWWEFDQTSQEWSLVGPLSKLFKWFRFIAYLGHRS